MDGGCRNKNCLKGGGGNDVQLKKRKEKLIKIYRNINYNNSSRRFKPLGSRVMAISIKCDSLALRTEGRGVVLAYNIGPKGPTLEPNLLCFSRGSRFFAAFNLSHQLFLIPLQNKNCVLSDGV